ALSTSNPMGLQSIAAAGGLSLSGNGVGAAIVVNVIDADTIARIASSSTTPTVINAGGAISLSATSGISALAIDVLPISVPDVTTVAIAGGVGTGTVGAGGSVIVDVVDITTHATIGDHAQLNQSTPTVPTQSLSLVAVDNSEFVELVGAIGLTGGSVGVGFSLALGIHNKDVRAVIGSAVTADVGGNVTVKAEATEAFTIIAAGASAASTAGVTG